MPACFTRPTRSWTTQRRWPISTFAEARRCWPAPGMPLRLAGFSSTRTGGVGRCCRRSITARPPAAQWRTRLSRLGGAISRTLGTPIAMPFISSSTARWFQKVFAMLRASFSGAFAGWPATVNQSSEFTICTPTSRRQWRPTPTVSWRIVRTPMPTLAKQRFVLPSCWPSASTARGLACTCVRRTSSCRRREPGLLMTRCEPLRPRHVRWRVAMFGSSILPPVLPSLTRRTPD